MNDGTHPVRIVSSLDADGGIRFVFESLDAPSDRVERLVTSRDVDFLAAICRAVNVLKPKDSSELHDRPLEVVVAGGEVTTARRPGSRHAKDRASAAALVARPAAVAPTFRSLGQLIDAHDRLRAPIVHGFLRQGEVANLVAAPKVGKSWLVADLAIAVATGRPWLGRFPTEAGEVLIVDNELHEETSRDRIPRVAAARGVAVAEIRDRLHVDNVRGRLVDIFRMGDYFAKIGPGRFRLVVLDAMYRFMPGGSDENSNSEMARAYNAIDRHASALGAAIVCVHHTSKGVQGGKSITDVGAGAGAQSRAADAHLVLRQHEEERVVVLDAAVRSWAPVVPLCLRWTFPTFEPADELDPAALKREFRSSRQAERKAAGQPWTVERLVEACVDAERPRKREEVVRAATKAGAGWRQAKDLFAEAVATGRVQAVRLPGRGGPLAYVRPSADLLDDANSNPNSPPHTPPVALRSSGANRNANSEALPGSGSGSAPKQRRKARKESNE